MSPITRGSLSCRFYRVPDAPAADYEARFQKNLERNWFREISRERGEEMSVGWVNLRQILDGHFDWHQIFLRPHLVLGLRKDKKTVNKSVLRARLQRKIDELIADKGKKKIGRQERSALEEQVKADLLAEQTPSTQVYEMAWNMDSGLVVFAATGESQNLVFQDFFVETFGCDLIPLNPFTVADRYTVDRGREGLLDDVWPTLFSPFGSTSPEIIDAALSRQAGSEEG